MHLRPRHIRRYRDIAEILADHGFGTVLTQIGLSDRLNLPRRILRRKPSMDEELSVAKRLRLTIEDLGPTYIKLGQILSTRSDLLPPDYLDELSYLQDRVAPVSWESAKSVIESELDASIQDLFAHIDPTPIAAASLAQVHQAILANGDEVVVKIQRPGIEKTIDLDLDILYDFANLAQNRTGFGERYELADFAEEFAISLRAELDFRREGRNADRFRENFSKEKHLYVPQVYWEYTTRRVLVQERITGIKIDNIPALDAAGYNRHRLATHAANFVLKEVLEDGYFHADPHPGNLLIMPGEVICVLDFGTVGRLDNRNRVNFARLFIVAVQIDTAGIVDQLIRMGIAGTNVNRDALQRDLRRILIRYEGLPINEIYAQEVLDALEPIIYEYQLRIPSDYWLLIKTVVLMQGVGLGLDPEFDIFETARPYLGRLLRKLWLPSSWGPSALRIATDWADFAGSFPRQTSRILEQVERGELEVRIQVPELKQTNILLNRIVNRLIFSILVAALTIALALLIPRLDLTWPWSMITWIIVFGFIAMIFLSLWLIWNIFRSGKYLRDNHKNNRR
ncbi:MAG: AarF/ABC1/UbiB kinase family protein [Anaerolineales bacterium]|nr:AarF/ABC1/UbiB kinase family protein [Anaerolineales bacterium]